MQLQFEITWPYHLFLNVLSPYAGVGSIFTNNKSWWKSKIMNKHKPESPGV